jgi:3-oxoacyl-[acyl-carrier protein] reductase
MFKQATLTNKVAIVTGGARGIGRDIVWLLAQEGAEVHFFYYQSQAPAQSLVETAKAEGLNLHAHQVDVGQAGQCQQAVQHILDKTQQVDVLVNNSGIVRDNLLVALEAQDIQAVVNTNLMGVFYMTQAVAPYMMSQRSGSIINISSVSGEKGGRGQSNYAATKGAINAFTKSMAVELAPRRVRINAVAPGVIETDISKAVREAGADEVLSKILLKRFGQASEVAYAVAFLASPFASYITGEILHVDGGFKMA